MTRHSARFALLVPFVFTLTSLPAPAQWDLSGLPASSKTFTDSAGLYSVQAPAGWTASSPGDGNVAFRWRSAALSILSRPGAADVSDLAESGMAVVKSVASNFTQQESSGATLAGHPARTISFQATGPKGEASSGILTAVSDARNGLIIVLTAPADGFAEYAREVSDVLATLKFAPRPGGDRLGSAAPVLLPERTPVTVALLERLSSDGSKKGQEVRYEVTEEVLGPNREVLIARGATAYGAVTRARHRSVFGKPGKLDFTIESVKAADGASVRLRAAAEMKKSGKNNATGAAATTLLFSPLGLLINGRDVSVKKGTEFTVYVDEDTWVKPNPAAPAQPPATPEPPAAAEAQPAPPR